MKQPQAKLTDFSSNKQTNIEGLPLFDICKNKHKGNRNSIAANLRALPTKQRVKDLILNILADHPEGLICHEIAEILGKPLNTFSGRLSDLKAEGLIVEVGERNNAAVLRRAV